MKTLPAFITSFILILSPAIAYSYEIPDASNKCNTGHGETTPSSNFRSSKDGLIISDKTTGLEWMRCPVGMAWDGTECQGTASTYHFEKFKKLAAVTGNDWRLPTIDELSSIVEKCRKSPAINLNVFPNTPVKFFWSSSRTNFFSDENFPPERQGVLFIYGSNGKDFVDEKNHARFVRNIKY